jgi:predicted outer membrane repeat protein
LRDAINAANGDPQSLIKFAPAVNGVIQLQQGDLDITTSMKIDATGNTIAVSGRGLSRVFNITNPAHVTFVGFTVKDGRQNGNGGCINVTDPASSLVLNNMKITLCRAVGGHGGGVYAEGLLTLYTSLLENNTADLDGGGAYAGRNMSLYNNSIVTDNRARNGGGLNQVRTGTTMTIWDSLVKFNFATQDGGGAYARFNIDLKNSSVVNNTATSDGGGLFSDDGNVFLNNSHVDFNTAITGNGGGMWVDYLVTAINGSTVNNNFTNGSGGGIFSDSGIVRIWSGSEVNTNTSNGGSSGGGIWAYYDVFVEDAEVNDNSSVGNGGGIYSAFGNVEIDESDVLGNVALDNGGGIYAYGNITLDDAQLGTYSQPNSAGLDGGGLYTSNGSFYIQEGSVVEGNTAGGDGGGAWGHVHGVVEDSTVRGNIANNDGGGIFMNTESGFESLLIHTSLIEFNEAGDEGGGVYVSGPGSNPPSESVTIIDSTFNQNLASINGGGLAARNVENIAITGSTFMGNRATSGRGGGMDVRNGNLYIVNCTFGGVYDNGVLVTPQSAAIGGGAIYVQGTLTTINHTTFNDNISYGGQKTGSAILSDSGAVVYLHNTMVNDTNEISSAIATELLSKVNGGLFKSMGHNLVHDFSFINVDDFDGDFGDIAFGVQALGPLTNNGGPTPTYLPVAGGQAIDAADDSGPIVDQRGSPRPIDLADIGSVEL